ncbi:LysR substrate-binding domain-containing protein [Owenweeksia hongkongensis]|uniref:Transcriptional regulator n=1 Tax=Owenweeksia hongkongensis (strain DSM 17368 / CIP 108786 / JCM 12287 / NRRL B-23963 / UST20020801) TaxID=926562 RepID=G8QZ65_OWEHD|nr:LysR substrate-binding domain-containing protein [Owenweeksia hongkongensis]AEV31448.1 transcriptional regulator [Owenweeksia hongkongensis DSM 17368]
MTITQLQYLIAVDNHRHFARAAEACFVTQPTLSMQIQKLEDELGVLLFDRSKHPVRPTSIGERIVNQARTVVHESERIHQILQEGKNQLEGPFKLGVIPTVASSLIPRFIANFHKKFPKIQLQIQELQTETILEKLRMDELDAGIMATPLDEKGIIEKPLYYEPFMAFIPENHRLGKESFVTNSELNVDDILLLNEGHCFRNSVLNICNQPKKEDSKAIKLESGNFETLVKLSKQGFGMTLIPYLHALDLAEEDQKLVKPIADPRPMREVSIVYTRAELKIKVIEELHKIILNNIPEKLANETEDVVSPLKSA